MVKISNKKTLTLILIVTVLVVLGCSVIAYKISRSELFSNESLTLESDFRNEVSYIINYGQGHVQEYKLDISEDSNVFSLLEELAERESFNIETEFYPEMGIFIKSIGEAEGGTDNKWWQYWVNGTLGETSADNKKIKAGDIIEWKFETLPF